MLKITLFILSLIVLPIVRINYWWVIIASLLIISPARLFLINSIYGCFSFFSSVDVMRVILVVLRIWISAIIIMARVNIKKNNNYSKIFVLINLLLLLILIFLFLFIWYIIFLCVIWGFFDSYCDTYYSMRLSAWTYSS